MTSPFESMINEMLAEIQKQRENLARLQQGAPEISGSARSKRRQVSATVDAKGELIELTFHGTGYRSLAPAELATIIVDTVRDAREEAHRQLWDIVGDNFPNGTQFVDVINGDYDWTDSLSLPAPLLELLRSPLPGHEQSSLFPGGPTARDSGADTDVETEGRDDGKDASTP